MLRPVKTTYSAIKSLIQKQVTTDQRIQVNPQQWEHATCQTSVCSTGRPTRVPLLHLFRVYLQCISCPSFIPSSAQSDLSSILFAHPSGGETKWTDGDGRTDGWMMGTDGGRAAEEAARRGPGGGEGGTQTQRNADTQGQAMKAGQTTQTLPQRPQS